MAETDRENMAPGKPVVGVPEDLRRFLGALFEAHDVLGVRPIETWTDPATNRKCSRVLYRQTNYHRARSFINDPEHWLWLQSLAERERANLFFTVAPRFGPHSKSNKRRWDLAWQIRMVRALWADLDHCTVEEALGRCQAGGLPRPSIVVCSGNGVHLYWILAQPIVVDDVGEPPGVETEFIDRGPDKKKLPRKVVCLDGGERVYLYLVDRKTGGDSATLNPECPWGRLSPKAQHIQDVLAGIASKIGGDNTSDLARLLRLVCTFNRKDQVNGREPVACELVECVPERRFTFAEFERFAADAPDRVRRVAAAKMRLPQVRKPTRSNGDRLDRLINECAAAPPGARSERDWNLVCWAVEHGVDPEHLWQQVETVGKFAERGRAYFDRTLANAQDHTRLKTYDRLERKHAARAAEPSRNGTANGNATTPQLPGPWNAHGTAGGDHGPPDGGGGDNDDASDPEAPPPGETLTDPHRLARAWLTRCAKYRRRGDSAAYYRQQYWLWRDGAWRVAPDHEIKASVNRFVRCTIAEDFASMGGDDGDLPAVTRELVSNVLAAVEGQVLVPQTIEQPCWRGHGGPGRRNWIALGNGILDVDALLAGAGSVLREHTPLWFSPSCLPYQFDPQADCPRWRAFLARNLRDDPGKQRLLQQWTGYLLLPDTSQQRFLAMVGEGANGKSVICEVFMALLGQDNVSTEPLELFGDKFRLVNTLGKLANITAEVGELDKMAEGYLKAFVVGDPMTFEQKFKQPFTARPTARLMLATNNAPRFSDKSDGIWRRMILLPFVEQIPEAERIAGMDKREFWQGNGELPGILNWALAGLADLRREGRFTVPKSCQGAADELRLESNPARLFLLENYEAGPGFVFKADTYQRYCEWCRERGYHALADRGFGKEIKRAFRLVKDGKATNPSTGKRENSYEGIDRVKDEF
jgi:P4 family phage/plasmid primase-like protien